MKREKGVAVCGLACCLCTESGCAGCAALGCPDAARCENLRCARARGVGHCYDCPETGCRKGMLAKVKPYAFTQYARRHGPAALLDRLAANEARGVVYHRQGYNGDYDAPADAAGVLALLEGRPLGDADGRTG